MIGIAELDPAEALVAGYDLLTEKKRGKTGSKRSGMSFPRGHFGYSKYGNDPRPDVLVLGDWRHPSTGNNLLAGINLNYLSQGQVNQLKDILDRLFDRKSLRARYRFLKSNAPDIAQYYRTYDKEFIRGWEKDEVAGYKRGAKKPPKEAEPEDDRVKTAADIEKAEHPDKPDKTDDLVDTSRKAWELSRRLYEPDTGHRTKPEHDKLNPDTGRSKRNKYKQQRKKLRELERQARITRAAKKREMKKELEPEWPTQVDIPYESASYSYSPSLGFIWESPEAYRMYHSPENFRLISENGPIMAVMNIKTGEILVDSAPDHSFILADAEWDYADVVRMSVSENQLTLVSDEPYNKKMLTEAIDRRGVVKLLV